MRPVLLTVDDDPNVVWAIERDLRRQYGKRFRILRAESGQKALGLVKQLKLRNEIVALLLADQRMPQISGVEFLEQSIDIFPEAKRVLLTAFADTEAAIRSINKARIDYYLMKPCFWTKSSSLNKLFITSFSVIISSGDTIFPCLLVTIYPLLQGITQAETIMYSLSI